MTDPGCKTRPRGNADRASKMLIFADSVSENTLSLAARQTVFVSRRFCLTPSLASAVAELAFSHNGRRA